MDCYFSIIIPMYNRARFIGRAIDSCLTQDFADFEIVVVDDGSTDDSGAAVRRYDDPRVRLFVHETNLGIGPARNSCVRHARGKWLVVLDSDNELLPGALQRIYTDIVTFDQSVQRLVYHLRLDNGEESPDPGLEEDIWNYDKYAKWSAKCSTSTDFFNVIHSKTFTKVRFPVDRGHEAIYHLDFAGCYLTRTIPKAVAIQHSDADNRSLQFTTESLLRESISFSQQHNVILDKHGSSMKKVSPQLYFRFLQGAITYNMLAGETLSAYRKAFQLMLQRAFSFKTLLVLIIGTFGPKPLALMKIRLASRQRE